MAGFRKAKAEQAALKMSLYGPPGSGKTATTLLLAEGLARHMGKRVAGIDTERGTDFYTQPVPERAWHPEAFDFDALYTRSLSEVLRELKALDPAVYGVVFIDSISHLWDAVAAAYTGPRTREGGIPMPAWHKLKAPYKDLMHWVINSPFHVFLLGRQGTEFEDDGGSMKAVGVKMRAEKETAHEPHVCIRMECVYERADARSKKKVGLGTPTAFVEKDRSGILQGRAIPFPGFDNLARPLLGLLGGTQARLQSEDEAAAQDAEAAAQGERARAAASRELRREREAQFQLAKTVDEVKEIGKTLTPGVKKDMLPEDVEALRAAYFAAEARVKGVTHVERNEEVA